jgi:Carboxypeptidase regulatory-like domain/Type VI secretion system effector, Hcp
MLMSHRGARVVGCSLWVALGLFALAPSPASPASPRAGVAAHRKPLPRKCAIGTDPMLGGNCVLNEGYEPCPSANAGCVRLGEVSAKPIASDFKIAVSPSVVSVGGSLNVTLITSLPKCADPLPADSPLCWSDVTFGDPRQRQSYLPLDYNGAFNPPLLRFPSACVNPGAPLSCTATVLRQFGPLRLLTDHYMIAGAQVGIDGAGSTEADYVEAAVGVSSARPVRLSGKVTGFAGPVVGASVEAVAPAHETSTTTTDSRGRYQLELPRGGYRVSVSGGIWEPRSRRVALQSSRSGVDFALAKAGRLALAPPGPSFDVTGFSFSNTLGVGRPGNPPNNGTTVVHLNLTKVADTTSAALLQAEATGHVFPDATLTVYKPGTSTVVAIHTLKDVGVTGLHSQAGTPPLEQLELTAGSQSVVFKHHH